MQGGKKMMYMKNSTAPTSEIERMIVFIPKDV